MLIESAGVRLCIDLLESLRKQKLEVTDIRLSFITKNGGINFVTFPDLKSIKDFYIKNYGRTVNSRRNPFTIDKRKAQISPVAVKGILLDNLDEPINNPEVSGICELGRFVSVERFNAKSTTFNYDVIYRCYDISDNLKIIDGKSQDLRRDSNRNSGRIRQKSALLKFISEYNIILNRLYSAYNANLYVDLCYVAIGYVKDSIFLYSIFFALVKAPLNTGLRLDVLKPRYLKRII